MKTLMVVCGSGVATSTVAEGKIRDFLDSKGLLDKVKIYKSNIDEQINNIDDYLNNKLCIHFCKKKFFFAFNGNMMFFTLSVNMM